MKLPTNICKVKSPRGIEYISWDNKQMLFLKDHIKLGLSDLWTDISTINLSREGGINFRNGKKPEKLLHRLYKLFTDENDIVLDFFLGSGTSAAVAHKMSRKYIGIEHDETIFNLATQRLNLVIDGEQSGISKQVNWLGGGSYEIKSKLNKLKYEN